RRLPELGTARLAFAGAYHGWGFHEDGAKSGVTAAANLGVIWQVGQPAPVLEVAAS
ncbi:MAG TPA: amine oxidase, partial [Pedococcus sp.]|nr:amine oxidase [Pedococcus sp.]